LAGEAELEDLANCNVELSTWECRPDDFNLRIGLCQLCILPMWNWQRGKGKPDKVRDHLVGFRVQGLRFRIIWYPILMFNPVWSHRAPNDALSVFLKFPCVPQSVLYISWCFIPYSLPTILRLYPT
jgi:hypothetical protein